MFKCKFAKQIDDQGKSLCYYTDAFIPCTGSYEECKQCPIWRLDSEKE